MTLLSSEHSVLIRSKFKSALKSPAAFHEQRKNLERSKNGEYLKHKIRSRSEKSELVNMRILHDGDGPAVDTHSRLKRVRLTEQNMSPVQEDTDTVNDGSQQDSYAFEEDSSSEESLLENKSSGSCSPAAESSRQHGSQIKDGSSQNQDENMTNGQENPPVPVPAIVKSKMSEKNRHKKPKDMKPKVKKLKYHQYIPPDQKAERSPAPQMDSAYARLLQQQQLFLQLQILSQQKQQMQTQQTHAQMQTQQSFSYHTLGTHTHNKQASEAQASCSSSVHTSTSSSSSNSSSPVKNSYCSSISPVRPAPLPANLDDLKVSELRQQLRVRGLPVSGTKTALIQRLRPFRDSSCGSPLGPGDPGSSTFPASSFQPPPPSAGLHPFCSSTPPASPASSDLSISADSFSDATVSPFGTQPSPAHTEHTPDAEKDKMLLEKQKVIEELMWRLQQEQRQVEELRTQLHRRRLEPHTHTHTPFCSAVVKQEPLSSSCVELQTSGGVCAFLSPQCSPQEPPLNKPCSSPQSTHTSPAHTHLLTHTLNHNNTNSSSRSGIQLQQKSSAPPLSCSYSSEQRPVQLYCSPSENSVSSRAAAKSRSAAPQREARSPSSPAVFCSSDCPASVSKRPPCYQDAVKQQMVRSQQMDELLDVLIESGVSPSGGRFHRPYDTHTDVQLEALLHRTHSQTHTQTHIDPSAPAELLMEPLSPSAGKLAVLEAQGLGLGFCESPWESMEWLDLTPPGSTFQSAVPPAATHTHNIFSSEFLDAADISLNLDQW
ncbi:myocardin isoform X2 [Danio aesculapii]|uniref:myocardin isoform X2 n=1 Tax=Danio aesculapii TaxID=1142201 RepID=UPI0024BFE1F5|nr:myocardin isoform X2 [Danio aesculapii]